MSEEDCINVYEIKHFVYCEAIPYIERALNIKEKETDYMEYGREIEKDKNIGFILTKLKVTEVLRSPFLISRKLNLCGRPDYVVVTKNNDVLPIEIKWSEPAKGGTAKRDHIIQLAAYALLLEDVYSGHRTSVKFGYIYYLRPEGKLVKIHIDYDLKLEVLKILKKMKDIISGRREPRPSKKRCPSCNFLRFCPYSEPIS